MSISTKALSLLLGALMLLSLFSFVATVHVAASDPSPPSAPVRLVFIHHSTGEDWLRDSHGGLGIALRDNSYYVSDTNYYWGPTAPGGEGIGSYTDIGNWWDWFRGPDNATYLNALYLNSEQHADYTRLATPPAGSNQVILFKSCFPNSNLRGGPNDPVPPISRNPLRGQDSSSAYHTVANAKGIYMDLLNYFTTRQDKLFIIATAPPLRDGTYASNARAFNQWLTNDYLKNYPHKNVFVFDYYNVLTTNGGDPNTNDLNQATGNHHRWWNNAIQHTVVGDHNVTAYPTEGDDHPSAAGDVKATGEFVPLLNIAYNQWKTGSGWGAWTNKGGQLLAGTSPAAYSSGGTPGWFVVGTNHNLYWSTGGSWTNLGGVVTSSPGATSPSSGVIDVFVRGSSGAIYQKHYSGGTWGASWTNLGGYIPTGTSPAVSSWGASREDLFVQGSSGAVYQKTWTGSAWSATWTNLGGYVTSSPAATSPASGVIDLFARGSNGALYTRHYSGGSWGAWTNKGGGLLAGTSPAAYSSGGTPGWFVVGTNHALYWSTGDSWTNLGGYVSSSPGATSPSSGVIDVGVRGSNGAVYEKIYTGG